MTSRTAPDGHDGPAPPSEIDRLRRRLDELSQQVLGARDAAMGAEAELAVARARVAELEQQVHVRTVEIDELRQALAEARSGPDVRTALAAGQRMAKGLGRRPRPAGS